MTAKRLCEDFSSFDSKVYSIVFNSGYGRLWNTCSIRKIILAHFLEFANYPHGFTDGNIYPFSRRGEVFLPISFGSHEQLPPLPRQEFRPFQFCK